MRVATLYNDTATAQIDLLKLYQCDGSNWDLFLNQYLFLKMSPISNTGKS